MKDDWDFNCERLSFGLRSLILYFLVAFILNVPVIAGNESSSMLLSAGSADEAIAPAISGSGSGEFLLNVTIKKSLSVYAGMYSLDLDKINMPPISSRVSVTPYGPGEKQGYTYDLQGLHIPKSPNSFIVTAKNVKNLNIGLRKYPYSWFDFLSGKEYRDTLNRTRIWVTTQIQADENGVAKIDSDLISPGTYDARIFGDVKDNATTIDITMTIIKKLIINGKFNLTINTTGFPDGNYFINAKALNGSFNMDQLTLDE